MLFGGITITKALVLLISLIISMVIHEFMHAFVAFKLGDTTAMEHGRLSFNPLKHIDPFMTIILPVITLLIFQIPFLAAKPVPFNPSRLKFDDYGAALVAAAGPATNIVLALIAAIILHQIPVGAFFGYAISTFASLNVALFIFNSVPIPPLDGSRVLYAFAPDAVRALFDQIEPYGFFIILVLLYMHGFNGLYTLDQMVINFLNNI